MRIGKNVRHLPPSRDAGACSYVVVRLFASSNETAITLVIEPKWFYLLR